MTMNSSFATCLLHKQRTQCLRNERLCNLPPRHPSCLHLHSVGKSAFSCDKDVIDPHTKGNVRKWDWCPAEKIFPPPGIGSWLLRSRLHLQVVPPTEPTTLHRLPSVVLPQLIVFLSSPTLKVKKPLKSNKLLLHTSALIVYSAQQKY